ncbi:MAG: response regulator [Candidatus Omnitrophica bacterium]|nr:response regulator [Candidatus Omnitrophota bacterium]
METPEEKNSFKNAGEAGSEEKSGERLGKILIVDDEKLFAFLLARVLRNRGYSASFVSNAEKALERIDQDSYDLVIVDIKMDGKSGYEMMKEVKAKHGVKSPTFLVGTGTQFILSAQEMSELKIYKIIEKPFPRPSKLFKEIEAAIQSHTQGT